MKSILDKINRYYDGAWGSGGSSGGVPGEGTVTSVDVVTANGVSATAPDHTGNVDLTFTLGAITPSSVNGVVVSGSATPTLAITGTTAVSGTNTGDEVTDQAVGFTITGGTTAKTLTVALDASVSGTNTGDSAGHSGLQVTITTGATDNSILRADGTGGSTLQNTPNATISDAGVISAAGLIDSSLTATKGVVTNASKQLVSTAYSIPTADGTVDQFMSTNGSAVGAWKSINDLYAVPNKSENYPFNFASTSRNFVVGIPVYYYINFNKKTRLSGISIPCVNLASASTIECGLFNWTTSGSITEYSSQRKIITLTTAGRINFTFATPYDLAVGTYMVGFVSTAGNSEFRFGFNDNAVTLVCFTGAGSATVLPATESTRTAVADAPFMEYY